MANKFFVEENVKLRLPEDMAVHALTLLEGKLENAQAISVQSFITDFCAPMHVVAAWRRQMTQRFGTLGPAFDRVLRMLVTEGGRLAHSHCGRFLL